MNNHRKYMKKRFPRLADEFDLIEEGRPGFAENDKFFEEFYDELSNVDVLARAFIWSMTPQGHNFWAVVRDEMQGELK